jgi:neurocan core protein
VRKIDDRGEFTCIAENAAGKVEQKTNFLVTVRPSITSFTNVSYDVNRESRLECRAHGDPRPILSIRKDGATRAFQEGDPRVAFEERKENEETVLIVSFMDTQREDDGLYYCAAENKNGQNRVERVGHLQVRFPPDLRQTPLTSVKTWDLRPVNMTCIAESIPNATINWWFYGVQIFNGRDNLYSIDDSIAGVSRLFVKPTQAAGGSHTGIYGAYKCEAENPLGRAEMTIKLEQAYRPSAILQVTHEKITPTTVTFKLVGPTNDGGLPVKTIHVQYREEEKPWETMLQRQWPVSPGSSTGQHGPYFLGIYPFIQPLIQTFMIQITAITFLLILIYFYPFICYFSLVFFI